MRRFARRAAAFVALAAVLYAIANIASEQLLLRYARRNRFFQVRSTPPTQFDYVILGASHAMVLDYRDMNATLERLTGTRIMNLSVVGAGVDVNALLLDYFWSRHTARTVMYFVDSFAFYSPEWNERRLQDTNLYVRAPYDLSLVARLFKSPAPLSTALDYAVGFSKLNNSNRFAADTWPDEGAAFERRYIPVAQVDESRLAYLYPAHIDPAMLRTYLSRFERLILETQSRGSDFVVVRPPLPERIHRQLPNEEQFDSLLTTLLNRLGVESVDFSNVANSDANFHDTDHLNRTGVLEFFRVAVGPMMTARSHPLHHLDDDGR